MTTSAYRHAQQGKGREGKGKEGKECHEKERGICALPNHMAADETLPHPVLLPRPFFPLQRASGTASHPTSRLHPSKQRGEEGEGGGRREVMRRMGPAMGRGRKLLPIPVCRYR